MMTLSLRAAARALKVDEKALRNAAKTGRLERSLTTVGGRPAITDLATLKQEWAANRDPSKIRGDDSTIAEERKGLIRAQTRSAEVKTQRLAGQLVDVAAVRRATFELTRTIRDNVLNVPDRVAYELAAEGDPTKIHARLMDELRQALGRAAEAMTDG